MDNSHIKIQISMKLGNMNKTINNLDAQVCMESKSDEIKHSPGPHRTNQKGTKINSY